MSKKGFSLTEIVVVIAIITILALTAVPAFNRSIKNSRYNESVTNVVGLLRDARNSAISNLKQGTSVPKGGYGVYIDATVANTITFTPFIDLNSPSGNGKYDTGENNPNVPAYTITFGSDVKNVAMSDGGSTTFTKANVIYQPNQGNPILNYGDTLTPLVNIVIKLERYDGTITKTLNINTISGFIEVK